MRVCLAISQNAIRLCLRQAYLFKARKCVSVCMFLSLMPKYISTASVLFKQKSFFVSPQPRMCEKANLLSFEVKHNPATLRLTNGLGKTSSLRFRLFN